MTLDFAAAVAAVAAKVREVEGIPRVYSEGAGGRFALPGALTNAQAPCAVVMSGELPEGSYQLTNGWERAEYDVSVYLYQAPGLEFGPNAAAMLVLIPRIIEKFAAQVKAGRTEYSFAFTAWSGLRTLTYGTAEYLGHQITIHVTESRAATVSVSAGVDP